MGRGEDPTTYEFSLREMASIEELLIAMLSYEPSERITMMGPIGTASMENWDLSLEMQFAPNMLVSVAPQRLRKDSWLIVQEIYRNGT